MPKHKKKHIVTHVRGKPVKPKKIPRAERGRPREYPAEMTAHTFVRSTPDERKLWESAAAYESQMLGLPERSKLSLNAWLLRAANDRAAFIAAKANGITVGEAADKIADELLGPAEVES